MKKIYFIFLCVILFCQNTYASNMEDDSLLDRSEVLKKYNITSVSKDEYVKRRECVVSVMKAIGVNETENQSMMNALFNRPVFYDRIGPDYGYVLFAAIHGIARGRYIYELSEDAPTSEVVLTSINKDGKIIYVRNGMYFCPDDYVTHKEAALFMIRCCCKFDYEVKEEGMKKIYIEDDNEILNKIIELGLAEEENFYKPLSRDDFNDMLYKFINFKMYYYYDSVTREIEENEDSEMTYIEHLSNNK